ncbi:recombinase family protein [Ralstonia solanacearum]|uniref:recombinase family protein n=1 Tax=Ralstonia solanacearum TaxID=305 RepID=UPI0005C63479|nr:recombinase family protein [Ralstonia solanacearum]MBB6591200.1 recombinase family protein [Ralstonia solanacearum]MBB6595394.1 recombinase family protein [Ralstonia solanacearum]MDB0541917.1 recombinase family protein [Ralstonia solanacearum]MDB0552275.1 recombinase family protein [Ralstonia solanacearum]MDB0556819.1 recombinase family protein [Ralstonia solanacearum]
MSKARVYSYLRFSDPKQAAGSSADRQIEYARRWAAERNLELDDTLSLRDEGLSAYHQRHVKQGALGVFLSAVEGGRIAPGSVLIVEGLDRLSRAEPIQAQAQLAQIVNAGITVVTASDGKEYNRERLRSQPMDLVYSLLVMIRAHEESDTKSKRVKAALRRQCQQWIDGKWRGIIRSGRDPHWVEIRDGQFALVPERVAAVREALALFSRGHGKTKILRTLTERGLSMSNAGNHGTFIYRLVRNPMLMGTRVFEIDKEEFRLEGYYPALLSPEEFAVLQHLADERKGTRVKGEIPGLLTGLGITHCGYCGAAMVAQNYMGRARKADGTPQDGHRRLHCVSDSQNSGCVVAGSVSIVPIERAIMTFCADQMNLTKLIEGDDGSAAVAGRLALARQKASGLQAQLERLTTALLADDGNAPPATFLRRARELEEELSAERRVIESLEREVLASASTTAPAAADVWAKLTHGVLALDYESRVRARQLVADTFSRIVIYHAGFRPGEGTEKRIGIQLVAKHGNVRMLDVDRKSGGWRAAEDFDLRALT